MKIEIGEYVRTKNGYIHKIVKEEFKDVYADTNGYWIHIKEMTKHSKNIIDLIEVGDYVNGSKVIEVDNCKGAMKEVYLEGQNPEKECGIYFEQIETILTHEQYEENCYKVVE